MFTNLKLAFQAFKRNMADYLAISFVFAMIVFIGILIGQSIVGMLLAFIIVIIPVIISLKFCVFQAYDKPQIEYRSLKLGFLTFFKSIRVYFVVILKPLLIALLVGMLSYSFFLEPAIERAGDTIPNLMESLSNYDTFYYTYEEMLKISDVKMIMDIGSLVSIIIGSLVFFALKLKRDFIPLVAFEMPINSKRAITMNNEMLKGKNYFKFFLSNLSIILMLIFPIGLAYLTKIALDTNAIFSDLTINLLMTLVFCLFAAPIVTLMQLHYVYSYKSYSKPLKEEFNNELKNVIKEMEELAKKIDANNEK